MGTHEPRAPLGPGAGFGAALAFQKPWAFGSWGGDLLAPTFFLPASLILLALSALVCHPRRLLRSGWILPGETSMEQGLVSRGQRGSV